MESGQYFIKGAVSEEVLRQITDRISDWQMSLANYDPIENYSVTAGPAQVNLTLYGSEKSGFALGIGTDSADFQPIPLH